MPVVDYTVVNGELLSENRAGVERDYVPDSLGSTVALLDSTQSKTDTFTYWPYGEVRTRTGTSATPFQFVGSLGYYRDSSGRIYVRARIERPDLSRWQTEDPLRISGGDLNLYRYAFGSPTLLTDPLGTKVYRCCTSTFGHCFISTHLCGSAGFHPKQAGLLAMCWSEGYVQSDDDYLECKPMKKWDPVKRKWTMVEVCFPGIGRTLEGGGKVECEVVSTDPAVEKGFVTA